MNTVPAHLYKHVIAETIVRDYPIPSLGLAFQIIRKFDSVYNNCFQNDSPAGDCAKEIWAAWKNDCAKPNRVELVSPLDKRLCLRHVKL